MIDAYIPISHKIDLKTHIIKRSNYRHIDYCYKMIQQINFFLFPSHQEISIQK